MCFHFVILAASVAAAGRSTGIAVVSSTTATRKDTLSVQPTTTLDDLQEYCRGLQLIPAPNGVLVDFAGLGFGNEGRNGKLTLQQLLINEGAELQVTIRPDSHRPEDYLLLTLRYGTGKAIRIKTLRSQRISACVRAAESTFCLYHKRIRLLFEGVSLPGDLCFSDFEYIKDGDVIEVREELEGD